MAHEVLEVHTQGASDIQGLYMQSVGVTTLASPTTHCATMVPPTTAERDRPMREVEVLLVRDTPLSTTMFTAVPFELLTREEVLAMVANTVPSKDPSELPMSPN